MRRPTCNFNRFRFGNADCLYLDHVGQRVVADVEGCGWFQVVEGDTSALSVRGQGACDMFPKRFEDGLTIIKRDLGPSEILVSASPVATEKPDWMSPEERTFTLVDRFSPLEPQECAARNYQVLRVSRPHFVSSSFSDGELLVASTVSQLNASSWEVALPANVEFLLIRKLYDRFHGRQRARVLVNGGVVGWWYEPTEDRLQRWAWAEYVFPWVPGLVHIQIGIDPPPASPLWNVSQYEIWANVRYP